MSVSENRLGNPRVAYQVAFGEIQRDGGSLVMPLTVDFTNANPFVVNLQNELMRNQMPFVQAIYLDNSNNPNSLSVQVSGTNQVITIAGGAQLMTAILCTVDNPTFVFSTIGNTQKVPIQLMSFPVPAEYWPSSIGSTGNDASNNPPATLANLIKTVAVNGSRAFIEVQNQDAALIQVVLDDGTGANQSIILLNTAGANTGGGDWSSTSFKGRLRIFSSVANPQVMVHWD